MESIDIFLALEEIDFQVVKRMIKTGETYFCEVRFRRPCPGQAEIAEGQPTCRLRPRRALAAGLAALSVRRTRPGPTPAASLAVSASPSCS